MTTSTYSHRIVLWVDDDGPGRFIYETLRLQRSGWQVRWAISVAEAMERLRNECFDAVLLDQFLPLGSPVAAQRADAWGGCRLVYWLRGLQPPVGAPEMTALEVSAVGEGPPREENRGVKVVIVSAFFDSEIVAAIGDVPGTVPIIGKPIEIEELIDYLG